MRWADIDGETLWIGAVTATGMAIVLSVAGALVVWNMSCHDESRQLTGAGSQFTCYRGAQAEVSNPESAYPVVVCRCPR